MNEKETLEQEAKESTFIKDLVSLSEEIELKTPNNRYCVIEDANTYKGYCNGFLQDYERDLLQKDLKKTNLESGIDGSLPVEIFASVEKGLANVRLESGEMKQAHYRDLVVECGSDTAWRYTLRMRMADNAISIPRIFVKSGLMKNELGDSAEELFVTVTNILRRRINNTTWVEIRIV